MSQEVRFLKKAFAVQSPPVDIPFLWAEGAEGAEGAEEAEGAEGTEGAGGAEGV